MSRLTLLLLLSGLISSCSGSGGSSAATPSPTPSPWTSYSVVNAAALPTCAGDIIGRLYYVEESSTFQTCKSTGWTILSVGRTISSIKNISGSSTDFCTQYSGEECQFLAGSITMFSDNSALMSISFGYSLVITGDTDVDLVTDTFMIPPTYNTITKGISPYIARGSGYKTAYVSWDRTSGAVRYYLDTNGDGNITGADELLLTPTLTQIYP